MADAMTPEMAVWEAVQTALLADATVAAVTRNQVFDEVPGDRDAGKPHYIELGSINTQRLEDQCANIWTIRLRLFAVSTDFARKSASRLAQNIKRVLNKQELALADGFAMEQELRVLQIGDVIEPPSPKTVFVDIVTVVSEALAADVPDAAVDLGPYFLTVWEAMQAVLLADDAVAATTGHQVFDEVPGDRERGKPPYIRLGPVNAQRLAGDCADLSQISVRLFVTSTAFKRKDAWLLAQGIKRTLNRQEFALADGFAMEQELRVQQMGDVIDPPDPKTVFLDLVTIVSENQLAPSDGPSLDFSDPDNSQYIPLVA